MANTYVLLNSSVLNSDTASITFSSIPQTYTDLVLKIDSKNTVSDWGDLRFNANTSSVYSSTNVRLNWNTTAVSSRETNANTWNGLYFQPENVSEADSIFGSTEIYIPNYTASTNKQIFSFSAQGKNGSYTPYLGVIAGYFRDTNPITSITIYSSAYLLMTNSSFYLYGIKNS